MANMAKKMMAVQGGRTGGLGCTWHGMAWNSGVWFFFPVLFCFLLLGFVSDLFLGDYLCFPSFFFGASVGLGGFGLVAWTVGTCRVHDY
jgi:hypothetical protein